MCGNDYVTGNDHDENRYVALNYSYNCDNEILICKKKEENEKLAENWTTNAVTHLYQYNNFIMIQLVTIGGTTYPAADIRCWVDLSKMINAINAQAGTTSKCSCDCIIQFLK